MQQISWSYVKPLCKQEAVQDFLKTYQISLPSQLIQCLESNNGGRPSIKLFSTNVSKDYIFKSLLSYNVKDIESIYKIYPSVLKNTKLFPIGSDAAGNFICYHLDKEIYVLWKHETNSIETILRTL